MTETVDQRDLKAQPWPTLGETTETCQRCGKSLTGAPITSRWSPARFTVACPCSPREWILMEFPTDEPK